MPSLDVSAALQAAVAAAAEIARVGLTDDLVVLQEGSSNNNTNGPTTSNPHLEKNSVVTATVAPSTTPLQQQQQALYPPPIVEVASGDSEEHCTAADNQNLHNSSCNSNSNHNVIETEIHEHHSHNNDTASVTSSNPDHASAGTTVGEEQEGNAGGGCDPMLEETEEDAAKRLARSRERNREHARRTRLRKKAQLEHLQQKVRGLEGEKKALKQKMEECSIASILVNLAEPPPMLVPIMPCSSSATLEEQQQHANAMATATQHHHPPPHHQNNGTTVSLLLDDTMNQQENHDSDAKISLLTAGKRKRFASIDATTNEEHRPIPQALKLKIDGQTKIIGPKSHVNWKSGVYSDDHGVQRQLTLEQLEGLRRERNRMHAKMTRDRKKNFIATIEKTIEELERDCQRMRDVLNKVGAHEEAAMFMAAAAAAPPPVMLPASVISPLASPHFGVTMAPTPCTADIPKSSNTNILQDRPVVSHAFSLPAAAEALINAAKMLSPEPTYALSSLSCSYPDQEPELKPEHPPIKRVKVAHGFSWNG